MAQTMITERRALSVRELKDQLGISRGTAYKIIHKGQIPSVRVGNRILVPAKALEEFLEGKR